MMKYTLIGHKLTHSISPLIQNALFAICKYDGQYDLTDISPEKLKECFPTVALECDGFNITIPHKVAVLPFFDLLSDEAKAIGSVNTAVKQGGRLIGYNTDAIGFERALEASGLLSLLSKDTKAEVLLLGSGGVCRTFAHVCLGKGAKLTIAARNVDAALDMANGLCSAYNNEVRAIPLSEAADFAKCRHPFIINGTPVGMYPHVGISPVNEDAVKNSLGVFDAIYNPTETLLLTYAKRHGIPYANGLYMLIYQAVAAQELWTGYTFSDAQIESVAQLCEKHFAVSEE